jgi:transglutaminase-like putative cysteine protease
MIYGERAEAGVQAPAQTIRGRRGTCRDFAWLMVEGLRSLGFAARFVTGYLYDPAEGAGTVRGSHATHAWCEVFLPSWGWTEFDPTNGLTESADLIPVAIARSPSEAAPVAGTLIGDAGKRELHVDVDVRLIDPNEPAAQAA